MYTYICVYICTTDFRCLASEGSREKRKKQKKEKKKRKYVCVYVGPPARRAVAAPSGPARGAARPECLYYIYIYIYIYIMVIGGNDHLGRQGALPAD